MLKLVAVVCFGTVAMSQMLNQPHLSDQEVDWSTLYKPNPFFGTKAKNVGHYQPNRELIMPQSPDQQTDASPQYSAWVTNTPISPIRVETSSHCENSEILFKIWSIFFNLLNTDGEAKNPDMEKVKLALKLIKEHVEKGAGNSQNNEVSEKLLTLEEALLKNEHIHPESKRALRTIHENIDTNDNVLTSSHRLPGRVKDANCIQELANVIQTAQKSYIQLIQSPICKDSLASPETFIRRSDSPLTVMSPANIPTSYKRADFNNIQNLNAKNNEALKSSLGLLMNQSDYSGHDVFKLLQNYKPIQPTESPVDAVEPVVNDSKPFNPNQTVLNSNLQASDYNASQTSNNSQPSDNVAINDWTNNSNPNKFFPLNPNEIELTYAIKRTKPLVYQPYYFIKYRLPFNSFLQNLGKVTQIKSRDTSKSELYKSVIQNWNADVMSPDLAYYTKEQVNDLVMKEGNLVEALLIQSKDRNLQINLNTPENLESQLSEYNIAKDNTENGDGNLIEPRAIYSPFHNDESRRRLLESNTRPGLDTPPRVPRYASMVQPTPLKSYSNPLLYKSG